MFQNEFFSTFFSTLCYRVNNLLQNPLSLMMKNRYRDSHVIIHYNNSNNNMMFIESQRIFDKAKK